MSEISKSCVFVLTFAIVLIGVHSANVLLLSVSLSAGNHICNREIAAALVNLGHNVTFLTPELDTSDNHPLLHFIHLEGVYEKINRDYGDVRENHLQSRQPVFRRIKEYYRLSSTASLEMTRTKGIQKLLDYPPTFRFDAIIHDSSSPQSLLGFWLHFDRPPLISLSPSNVPFHVYSLAHIPLQPGFMLHPYAEYSTDLVLSERVYNTIYHWYDRIYRKYSYMRGENLRAKKLFGDDAMPVDLEMIEENTQIFLINRNAVIDSSIHLPPAVIPVPGLQIHRTGGLHGTVKRFLDQSKSGVIVFSLGTGLQTPTLTREEDEVFMEVFQRLYQFDVVWKYDKTEKLECPRNILMLNWLENQHLILQHPKVKLFITNGGPLSVQEATWAGVPIIGIPMRFDQRQILSRLHDKGVAQLLSLRRLRNDTLHSAIMAAVVENSSYRANASKIAQLLRSQPDSENSLQRAVEWIEYTMANADLKHLQSPLATVPFLLVYSLDLILVLAVIIIGFLAIVFKHVVLERMLAKARQQQQQQVTDAPTDQATTMTAISKANELPAIVEEQEEDQEVCNIGAVEPQLGLEEETNRVDKKND